MNTIQLADLENIIDTAERQEAVFMRDKELVISYKLQKNGFTVTGRAACVDPKNFSMEAGREIARQDAIRQLWQLEGYLLQEKLFGKKIMSETLTDNQQLKPCPFCGYEDVRLRSNITLDHYVWCFGCGTSGPHKDTAEEAARRWNERDTDRQSRTSGHAASLSSSNKR